MSTIEVYTDGACSNNGYENARGGWAYAIWNEDKILTFGAESDTDNPTNQKMELLAMANAFAFFSDKTLKENSCFFYTDSAYLHNCWKDKWYLKWEVNGWLNSKKEPVANKEIWERLIPFFKSPYVQIFKVKGHSTDERNNFVDKLAVTAKNSQD